MKRIFITTLAALSVLALFSSCSKKAQNYIKNKDKPIIFQGLLPLDSQTGKIDMEVMNWNEKTYHVGCDALRGGFVQARMVTDFIEKSDPKKIDRNGDGIIGYMLCIGDIGHKDSRGRTEAVRTALGTWNGSCEAKNVKDGSIKIGENSYIVRELDGKIMTGTDGSTWNAAASTEAMANWVARYGDEIDLVIANNDQMAMGCLQISNYPAGLPIFGYDAVADAIEAVEKGSLTGTVFQNPDGQVELIWQLLRNMFDNLSANEIITSGITKPDMHGNQIAVQSVYIPEQKSFLIDSIAVTKDNYEKFKNFSQDKGISQIDAEEKKVFYSTFSASDTFQTVLVKQARYYEDLFKFKGTYASGDGFSETSILDKLTNPGKYDAYVIGLLRETSARDYLDKLKY